MSETLTTITPEQLAEEQVAHIRQDLAADHDIKLAAEPFDMTAELALHINRDVFGLPDESAAKGYLSLQGKPYEATARMIVAKQPDNEAALLRLYRGLQPGEVVNILMPFAGADRKWLDAQGDAEAAATIKRSHALRRARHALHLEQDVFELSLNQAEIRVDNAADSGAVASVERITLLPKGYKIHEIMPCAGSEGAPVDAQVVVTRV